MKLYDTIKKYSPGLLLVIAVSASAYFINESIKHAIHLEAVTIAIVLGIIISNTLKLPKSTGHGMRFSARDILQYGIILLGFKLDFSAVLHLGYRTIILIALFTPIAIYIAYLLGRVFRIKDKIPLLIGIGSGICGASAIVAMSPVVRAKDEESVVAVSIVNFLGAIGVLVYSFIATQHLVGIEQYGIWSGISLQGVAHALAAAFAGGDSAGELGTIVKMGRVLMLVPVALFFSVKNHGPAAKVKFPWYVLFFVLAGVLNSLNILPDVLTGILARISGWFILIAMTAMGLSVKLAAIRKSGARSLVMGSVLFVIISISTFIIVSWIY